MSALDNINATLANDTSTDNAAPASKGKRGFTVKGVSKDTLATARQWLATYDRGVQSGKYPRVGFSASASNFLPMVVVAMVAGFTSEADAIAKVRAVQKALGVTPTDRNNLGLLAMRSESAVAREKTMRSLAVDWIARADAKGVYRLQSTKPSERVAVRAIRGNGKLTGDKPIKAKRGKQAKATSTDLRNGPVKVTVDKALRSSAAKAERAAQRKANRAKQAAQSTAPTSAD